MAFWASIAFLVSVPPALLITQKAVVTTEDGRVSFSFHHVHFGLWDVMFSVLSSRGSDDPSVIAGPISDPFSAPCLEAYLSVPVGCHFSLLSIPFQSLWVFFSPAHLL